MAPGSPPPVRHAILLQRAGVETEERELLSAVTAGGSRADRLSLPGAPAGAIRLQPCAAGVIAEARATGVRAAGRPLLPGARRLLRPGEGVEVGDSCIRLPPAAVAERTCLAAAALLRDAAASPDAPVAGPHLLVLTGASAGTRYALVADQVLGRGRSAAIRLADPLASRRHARLRLEAGGASVEDLGSKNGLRVNGVAVERRPCPLQDGDEIAVGETVLALVNAPAREATPSLAAPGAAPSKAIASRTRAAAAALLGLCAAALALAS